MIELSPRSGSNPARRIKILGIGGAGANALDRLALDGVNPAYLVALNTDTQALTASVAGEKIQLGRTATRGLGSGGDPDLGCQAAEEAREEIRSAVESADIVFIVAGLGGGTGSGATPLVTEIARDSGALVISIVTLPFTFEGKRRVQQAAEALELVRHSTDAVVCFANDRMGDSISPKAGIQQAFAAADQTISQSVQAIAGILTMSGPLHLGFDDFQAALRSVNSRCLFGYGTANGDNRPYDALARALKSPLMDRGRLLRECDTVLVQVAGGPDLTLNEVQLLMEEFNKSVHDQTRILFGVAIDAHMQGRLAVAILSSVAAEEPVTRAESTPAHPPVAQAKAAVVPAPSTPAAPAEPVTPEVEPEPEFEPVLESSPLLGASSTEEWRDGESDFVVEEELESAPESIEFLEPEELDGVVDDSSSPVEILVSTEETPAIAAAAAPAPVSAATKQEEPVQHQPEPEVVPAPSAVHPEPSAPANAIQKPEKVSRRKQQAPSAQGSLFGFDAPAPSEKPASTPSDLGQPEETLGKETAVEQPEQAVSPVAAAPSAVNETAIPDEENEAVPDHVDEVAVAAAPVNHQPVAKADLAETVSPTASQPLHPTVDEDAQDAEEIAEEPKPEEKRLESAPAALTEPVAPASPKKADPIAPPAAAPEPAKSPAAPVRPQTSQPGRLRSPLAAPNTGGAQSPAPAATPKQPTGPKLPTQETLQFEPVTRGRFEKSEPTIVDGQDLDVPTFLRRNVRIR